MITPMSSTHATNARQAVAPFAALAIASCAPSPDPGPVVPVTEVERQMIGLLEKFDRWDDDGDGHLDQAELAVGLEGTPYRADRVIAFYDTNGDRRISLREAQAGYHRAAEAEAAAESRANNR